MTFRAAGTLAASVVRAAMPASWAAPVRSTARWDAGLAGAWRSETGWLVGCNYIPSSAGNQLEMWQEDTFDPDRIDLELGWASGLGFNSVRVFLHDRLFHADQEGFLDRIDAFLSIAERHRVRTMLVLLDGVWDPRPRLGPQRGPRPGVHNSMWVQSPGSEVLSDRSRWTSIRAYVAGVIGRFATDERVVVWDLFNEPDNPNVLSYPGAELGDKHRLATELMERVFDWAQEADPLQPLTSGVFFGVSGATEWVSRLNRVMLARSDVVSFHCYGGPRSLIGAIDHLSEYRRPLLCTEWLGRPRSPVGLLETMASRGVGAYCWGLVDGRTQTRYPWSSWVRPGHGGKVWFHDLLHADGQPYSATEAAFIRGLCDRYVS